MPMGVLIDCLCVLIGGTVGAKYRSRIPARFNEPLTVVFGICAMGIGIASFIKFNGLPVVILALVMGAVIGEALNLEDKIKGLFSKVIKRLHFRIEGDEKAYMSFYLIVAVTFCASGTNIFGAMNEGMTGDMSILLSKAAMDIFASAIFATTLGYAMNLIVLPQCVFLSFCFYLARVVMPIITPEMLADFVAVGGLLTFILGLSIAKIKPMRAANLLPALILVFPLSYGYTLIF